MSAIGEEFTVDTRPSKEVVVDSLIRDITIEACIFDLIDNSIDAARDTLYKLDPALERDSSPASYENFKIKLTIDGEKFIITDNCGGISQLDLSTAALRFGQRSTHDSGIGVFGVGLNRAIFKLGRDINLDSDTGRERCTLTLDTSEYLKTEEWDLPATSLPSQGRVGTTLSINKIAGETSRKFSDAAWESDFIIEIGRRYGKYLEKGLDISINDVEIQSELIKIRTDSHYDTDRKFFKPSDEVSVHIEAGQHIKHKFSVETGGDKNNSRELTKQYGWTIFCNDRAVIVSDQTWKTGWLGKFHTQFYGFVGNVYFYSKYPEKLPWSTTKTDVDLNNPAYQTTLEEMKKFTQKWRVFSDKMKEIRAGRGKLPPIPTPATIPTPAKPNPATTAPSNPATTKSPVAKPVIKQPTHKLDHNTFETLLPIEMDELYCDDKHLALVHEAKIINLNRTSYSALLLMRTLFEVSSIWFLIRKEMYTPLKKSIIEKRNSDRQKTDRAPLSKVEENNASPTLDEIIVYLEANETVWDDANRKSIKHSLKKFAQHKEKLNSAVHSHFQPISKLEAFQMRDEVLPILRYLLTAD
ncbi:ATP-binding protein [Pseudomonas sp. B33.4]|uniref:ATP-binding protein n=1 Tax=Pseudomonas sp. B33.4 TaxID=3104265 RepID=UPI002ADEE4C1|nr:ATP-binding protein [Pseudomonas sp. B33.4]